LSGRVPVGAEGTSKLSRGLAEPGMRQVIDDLATVALV